jgi:hypothetical protein
MSTVGKQKSKALRYSLRGFEPTQCSEPTRYQKQEPHLTPVSETAFKSLHLFACVATDNGRRFGKLLGPHEQNLSLVRTSQLSWQQLADNNVIFVGVQNLFFNQLRGMPIEPQLIPELEGIRNINPAPGEPALYQDKYSTAPAEEGMMYALVTHLAGPLGNNDVESFTSVRSAGYVAAVRWFTDPSFARILVPKLERAAGGKMPRYYQVLLRVKFKDNVPTEMTYVLSKVLH